ncbi:MAG: hypothetical protein ACI8RD_012561 [Bacillariaceae sp.]|jgi:hypothetical protein
MPVQLHYTVQFTRTLIRQTRIVLNSTDNENDIACMYHSNTIHYYAPPQPLLFVTDDIMSSLYLSSSKSHLTSVYI